MDMNGKGKTMRLAKLADERGFVLKFTPLKGYFVIDKGNDASIKVWTKIGSTAQQAADWFGK